MATKKRGSLSQYAKQYPKSLKQDTASTGYMVPVPGTMHEFNDAEKEAYIKNMFGGQTPNPSGVMRNVGSQSMPADSTRKMHAMPLKQPTMDDFRGYAGGGGVNSDEYTGDADQDVPGYVNPGGAKTTYNTPSSTAPQGKPMSFGQAFAQARKSGAKDFTWNGKKFTTALKSNTTSSAPRANDEDHVYRPNTRNTVVPIKQHTPADGGMNPEYKRPRTLPQVEIVADRTHYDTSPAIRHSDVDRVMNAARARQAQTDKMDKITRQGFATPRKKGGLLNYVKGGMVKGYANGGRVEKSALADNDPNKTNPDVAYVVRTGGGDYPVFYKDSKSAHDWRSEYASHAQNGEARFKSTVTGLDYAIRNGGGSAPRVTPKPTPPAPAPQPTPAPVEPTPAPEEKGWRESVGEELETWGNRIARTGQGAWFAGKLLSKFPKTGKAGAVVTTAANIAQGIGPITRAAGQALNPYKDVDYQDLLMDLGLLAIATGAHKKLYGKGKDLLSKRGAAKPSAPSSSPSSTTPVETVDAVVSPSSGKRNVAPQTTKLLQARAGQRALPAGPSGQRALPAGPMNNQRALPAASSPKQLGYTPQPKYSNPNYKARPLQGEEYDWAVQEGFEHGGGVHQLAARLKKSKSFKTNFNR